MIKSLVLENSYSHDIKLMDETINFTISRYIILSIDLGLKILFLFLSIQQAFSSDDIENNILSRFFREIIILDEACIAYESAISTSNHYASFGFPPPYGLDCLILHMEENKILLANRVGEITNQIPTMKPILQFTPRQALRWFSRDYTHNPYTHHHTTAYTVSPFAEAFHTWKIFLTDPTVHNWKSLQQHVNEIAPLYAQCPFMSPQILWLQNFLVQHTHVLVHSVRNLHSETPSSFPPESNSLTPSSEPGENLHSTNIWVNIGKIQQEEEHHRLTLQNLFIMDGNNLSYLVLQAKLTLQLEASRESLQNEETREYRIIIQNQRKNYNFIIKYFYPLRAQERFKRQKIETDWIQQTLPILDKQEELKRCLIKTDQEIFFGIIVETFSNSHFRAWLESQQHYHKRYACHLTELQSIQKDLKERVTKHPENVLYELHLSSIEANIKRIQAKELELKKNGKNIVDLRRIISLSRRTLDESEINVARIRNSLLEIDRHKENHLMLHSLEIKKSYQKMKDISSLLKKLLVVNAEHMYLDQLIEELNSFLLKIEKPKFIDLKDLETVERRLSQVSGSFLNFIQDFSNQIPSYITRNMESHTILLERSRLEFQSVQLGLCQYTQRKQAEESELEKLQLQEKEDQEEKLNLEKMKKEKRLLILEDLLKKEREKENHLREIIMSYTHSLKDLREVQGMDYRPTIQECAKSIGELNEIFNCLKKDLSQ